MSLSSKILIFIGALVLFAIGGIVIYKQFEITSRQASIEKQIVAQKDLANGITRALSQYATKQDIDNFAKENSLNLNIIKDDLEKLNASITSINVVQINSKPQSGSNLPSTGSKPGENPPPIAPMYPDLFGYQQNIQTFKLDERFAADQSIPIGEVGFSAWKEKPWTYNIYEREYKVITVIGTDENQKQYAYNKFSIGVNGKSYDIKVGNSVLKQEYPEAKFSFFNPRLYLGVDGGVNIHAVRGEFTPNLSLQLMSYGKYKAQPDLSVLQIGIGYGIDAKRPSVSITPLMYNIGNHLPLVNNLYLGPSLQLNTAGDVGIMAGIKVGL